MDSHKQFIPAQPGWLALFEEATEGGVAMHAEPVVGWCLEEGESNVGKHIVSLGRAIIGAGPWIEGAASEKTAHLFAIVREEQLDPDFLEELRMRARHSREDLMKRAIKNHEERKAGHTSWVHDRRSQRADRPKVPPSKIF